ncbi:MAG: PspC domain-containing protein [Pseudobdellovibrionaceae bacterium]|nr:PspC domain-containing protein [Bdellovibrionales bacterium]USN46933.1 MAG: PspC domain-containing protein [Pseudobdellovibrionaceae bacterium]
MGIVQPVWLRAKDGKIAGVCAGVARALDVDVTLVRIAWFASIFFAFTGVLVYFVLAMALPREDLIAESQQPKVLGVCLRLARQYNVELGLIRVGALTLAILSFGGAALLYLVLHFVLPPEPRTENGEKIVN